MSDVDLERRLAALDSIEAPDLWARARSVPALGDPPPIGGKRWGPILVASLLSVVSLIFLITTFDRPQRPGGVGRVELDPAALEPAWRAEVPDAALYAGVEQDRDHLYVPTTTGFTAFPKACDDPCAPVWRADLLPGDGPGDPVRTDVAVVAEEGLVAATFDGSVAVFGAACRADGGLCPPLWTVPEPPNTNGYRDPVIENGIVKVTGSTGEMPNHHVMAVAFEARCRTDGGVCEPTWTGDLGAGTAYFPSAKVGDVFYQQVGVRMLGFDSQCRTDGGRCEPDFVVSAKGDPSTQASTLYGPVGGGGVLAIVSGDGNVYGYPEYCGSECAPLWFGPAGDYLESSPLLAGDLVVVTTTNGVAAFPLVCRTDGGECEPRWQVDLDGYASTAYADARVVIAANHSRDPALVAMETVCEGRCSPLWSTAPDGKIFGVASDGRTVFAATGRQVLAYPVRCSDPCDPVWRGQISGEAWWLLLDRDSLVVASREGGAGEIGLTLQVFESSG
jgi:hypothetical protein